MAIPFLTDDARNARFKRHDQLTQRRATYEPKWQNLAHLMRPTRATIRWHYTPGSPRTQQMFDGTALKAAHDLASALSGSFTSTEFQFFGLKMRYQPLNDIERIIGANSRTPELVLGDIRGQLGSDRLGDRRNKA